MSRKRREVYFSSDEHCRQSVNDHRKLLAAIVERDVEKAESILRQHIKGVDVYFRALFGSTADIKTKVDPRAPAETKRSASGRKRKPVTSNDAV
jgi:hypothetical protein